MDPLPTVTEAMIHQHASADSFQRGDVYHAQGAVVCLVHRGQQLQAEVEGSSDYSLIGQVVEAAIPSHPDWAIRMSREQAEFIMNQGKSQYYHQDGRWLEKARTAYRAAGGQTEWQTYLGELIARHRRKYSLVSILEALKR